MKRFFRSALLTALAVLLALGAFGCVKPAAPAPQPTKAPAIDLWTAPPDEPTPAPAQPSAAVPTAEPTAEPTAAPTAEPTDAPTTEPTAAPTAQTTAVPTAAPTPKPTKTPTPRPTATPTPKPTKTPRPTATPAPTIDEDGVYTSKDDVALYLYTYGHLPSNFITKRDAQDLGWPGGYLEPYAPGKCIGGDRFGNYERLLPTKKGRTYYECDIDTLGKRSRGAKRIIWSNDGLIYYTDDHYESFTLLYGGD